MLLQLDFNPSELETYVFGVNVSPMFNVSPLRSEIIVLFWEYNVIIKQEKTRVKIFFFIINQLELLNLIKKRGFAIIQKNFPQENIKSRNTFQFCRTYVIT